MSDKQPHPPDRLTGGQVPYLVKYLGSAQVEFEHSKELDKTTGYALVEKSIIKMKEIGKHSDVTAANLPKVKVLTSIDGIVLEDPKTKKVEHKFSLENVAYFGLGKTIYQENQPEKKYFAFLVKGTEGSREYSHCFVFLSDKFAEVLQHTVKQAVDIAYEKFLWKYKDGDKKNKDEEKEKEGGGENVDKPKPKKVVDRNVLLEEEIKVLKARLKDVAIMANKKQLRDYMDKNKIEDLAHVELESIEVAGEAEEIDFVLSGSASQVTEGTTANAEEETSLVKESKNTFDLLRMNSIEIPTVDISAPTVDISAPTVDGASAHVAFETNSFDPRFEIPKNNSQHDFDSIRQLDVMKLSTSPSMYQSGLPKSGSWTNLGDLDFSPVSLSSRGNSKPGSSNNLLSNLSSSPNFQAGASQGFGHNLAMEQPIGGNQILCAQGGTRPPSSLPGLVPKYPNTGNTYVSPSGKSASPFQGGASLEDTYSKLSANFTIGSPNKTANTFSSNNFSNPSSIPTSSPFPTNATNSFPATATNPFPSTSTNVFPTTSNSPFPAPANNPFPAQGNNPFPGQGNNPFPGQGNNPFPAQGNNSFPAQGNNPFPAQGNNPFPAQGNNPFPAQGNNPFPAQGNNPFPAQGNNPFPAQGNNPFPATANNPFPQGSSNMFPAQGNDPFSTAASNNPFPSQNPQHFPAGATNPIPMSSTNPFPSGF